MCKGIEGAEEGCKLKIHDFKCDKGHPLHLSHGKTFLCCRSGCMTVIFVNASNIDEVVRCLGGKT